MVGGNSHQRKMAKKADEVLQKKIAAVVHEHLATTSPKNSVKIKTDSPAIVVEVFGLVLAFVGLTETFPLFVNLIAYLVGVICIFAGVWRWETAANWGLARKILFGLVVVLVYWGVLAYPVSKQYKRETATEISFKDSPLFTWWRKQVMRHDIAGMRDYLSSLDIPTPTSLPPFSIGTGPLANEIGSSTPPNLPLNRSALTIGASELHDRRMVTASYTDYVIMNGSSGKIFQVFPYAPDLALTSELLHGFSDYFNASYWNKRQFLFPPGGSLWKLRSNLGAPFTDKLAAAALRTLTDDPTEVHGANVDTETIRALMLGDSIVESECDTWPKIRDILIGNGISRDEIKSQRFTQSPEPTSCTEKWAN